MDKKILQETVKKLMTRGKGILAIDESMGTCHTRFEALGVHCTEETRRAYRQILIAAPDTEKYLSGMILFDETLRQHTANGVPFMKVLQEKNIIPIIKVDEGTTALPLHEGESITMGLDNLEKRLKEYAELGAKAAKWRAVIKIKAPSLPTDACLYANAEALARYAGICQEQNIVPMVEPEVLMDGDHTIEQAFEVTKKTIQILFEELKKQDIYLPGIILKSSMVIAGQEAKEKATSEKIAKMTVQCFKESVPAEVGGIVFLSGGQKELEATENLNAMNKMFTDLPWNLSFSYGRSIQNPVLKIWSRDPANSFHPSSAALLHRCKMNSLAALGTYDNADEAEYNG